MLEHKIAKLISVIFHPLFIPLYGFILLFLNGSFIAYILPLELKLALLGSLLFLTILIPVFFVVMLKRNEWVDDLELTVRKQRTVPYMITIVFYLVAYYNFSHSGLPVLLGILMLASAFALGILVLSNFFLKISAHTFGMGALVATLFFLHQVFEVNIAALFLLLIFFSGLVSYARLRLNAHSPTQVYLGFLFGVLAQYYALYFLL